MRRELTREALRELMQELARTAPPERSLRVYFVGGGTAVQAGWRIATIDADLHADDEAVFRDVQGVKKRLDLNIELVRPEHFVPPLEGSGDRHVFVDRLGNIEYFHYDPYAQLLSKIVRGFRMDLMDAESFVTSRMVDPQRFLLLVKNVPDSAYARYPNLSRAAVEEAVEDFLTSLE
ncbi:MAG: hypothetical protein HKP01_07910 [Gemmatimonadetes bacterium]|nr:hypothetical protein [Gemmatimonadota bacterium]